MKQIQFIKRLFELSRITEYRVNGSLEIAVSGTVQVLFVEFDWKLPYHPSLRSFQNIDFLCLGFQVWNNRGQTASPLHSSLTLESRSFAATDLCQPACGKDAFFCLLVLGIVACKFFPCATFTLLRSTDLGRTRAGRESQNHYATPLEEDHTSPIHPTDNSTFFALRPSKGPHMIGSEVRLDYVVIQGSSYISVSRASYLTLPGSSNLRGTSRNHSQSSGLNTGRFTLL